MSAARWVYNKTLERLAKRPEKQSWMASRKEILSLVPEALRSTPFEVKGAAAKEATQAFFAADRNPKAVAKAFEAGLGDLDIRAAFKSRKEPEQSLYVRKEALSDKGVYYTLSGTLKMTEPLPSDYLDSRLIWRSGRWFLAVPYKSQRVSYGDTQARAVAIDPGIRRFVTFYSPDRAGSFGISDFSRLQRLATHLDKLEAKRAGRTSVSGKRLIKAAVRIRTKMRDLVTELHRKTARWLCQNFDIILLPKFETSRMVLRAGRKLTSRTARNMLTLSHYKFAQFLKHKAFELGKRVVECSEAYTSKTHPQTGEIRNIGGAKRIRLVDGTWADRDIVGARNILLRALVDAPAGFRMVGI